MGSYKTAKIPIRQGDTDTAEPILYGSTSLYAMHCMSAGGAANYIGVFGNTFNMCDMFGASNGVRSVTALD